MTGPATWMLEAAATCRDCEARVLRTENRWHLDEDGAWRVQATMVCAGGHRVLVEPF